MEEKEETVKGIIESYKELLSKKLGIKETPLANDEGKIILAGRRWILMDVTYFPAFMVKVTEEVVGPIAKEFIYWFGYAYGEKVTERYMEAGIPKEYVLPIVFAFGAVYAGWSVNKIEEFDYEKPYLRTLTFNDFETESAKAVGKDSDLKFSTGVVAGIFHKLTGVKPQVTKKRLKDGSLIVEYFARD
jgi:hypothetical protein